MAKILSDREIKRVLGDVIQGGETNLINPHGIELRLGKHVRFLSTGEDKKLQPGQFLKVSPGETVLISSFERIDFSSVTVRKHFPDCNLMGWISPTTTMMREGISQVWDNILDTLATLNTQGLLPDLSTLAVFQKDKDTIELNE